MKHALGLWANFEHRGMIVRTTQTYANGWFFLNNNTLGQRLPKEPSTFKDLVFQLPLEMLR